jgi:hypothetical protein
MERMVAHVLIARTTPVSIRFPKPNTNIPCMAINVEHLGELMAFLGIIGLIDAESVDPEPLIFVFRPQAFQRTMKVGPDHD